LTIHGKLPDFDPNARPGGYRAVFRNANGSVGVRYSAIDGAKKKVLARASELQAKGGKWHVSACSTSFEIVSMVSPSLPVAEQVAEAKRLFALIPSDLFFGSAYYARGLYGQIYVCASIGALYAEHLWPLCAAFFGFGSEAEIEQAQIRANEADAVKRAETEAYLAKCDAERSARVQGILSTLSPIATVPDNGTVFIHKDGTLLKVKLERERGRSFYSILERNGDLSYGRKRKLAKDGFPWPKALAAGRVFEGKE
jgi:hypothetical protein